MAALSGLLQHRRKGFNIVHGFPRRRLALRTGLTGLLTPLCSLRGVLRHMLNRRAHLLNGGSDLVNLISLPRRATTDLLRQRIQFV